MRCTAVVGWTPSLKIRRSGLGVGLALGLQRQKLDTDSKSRYELDSQMITAFAQYQRERAWADASLSYGRLDYSVPHAMRSAGSTDASSAGQGQGAGYRAAGHRRTTQ